MEVGVSAVTIGRRIIQGLPRVQIFHYRAVRPDGTQLAWGCCYDAKIQNVDHSNSREQLTFFNTPGYAEYSSTFTWTWVMAWDPPGNQVAVLQQYPRNPTETMYRTWVVALRNPAPVPPRKPEGLRIH